MSVSDVILLIILLGYTVFGAVKGLVATLVGLAVSVVAWIGSALVAGALAPDVPWALSFLVCFVLVQVLGFLLLRVLNLATKLPVLNLFNRVLGALLGFVRGAVLLAVVCTILVRLGVIPAESVSNGGLLALFSSIGTGSR